MSTKTLNKFINKLVLKNKFKLLTISVILALAMSIFVSFGLVNNRLQTANDKISNDYNAFDFKFVKENKLSEQKLKDAANKYNFAYEVSEQKSFNQTVNASKNAVIQFNQDKSQLATFDVRSNNSNLQISKNYITSGKANNNNEILVTKQLLDVYHKHLNDFITLKNKKYKIVGTFASPQYQKQIKTFITDKSQYVFPILMSKNDFIKVSTPSQKFVFAKFKKAITQTSRKQIYDQIKKDKFFQKIEKIEQFKITKEKITYNPNNLCSDKEEFENYSKLDTLSKQQFEKIKAVALQAQNGGTCRQTLDSPQLQSVGSDVALSNQQVNVGNVTNANFVAQQYQPSSNVTNEISQVANKVLDWENKFTKTLAQMNQMQGDRFKDYDKTQLKKYDNVASFLNHLQAGDVEDILSISSITLLDKTDPSKNVTLPMGGGAINISFANVKKMYADDKVAFEKEQNQKKQEVEQKNAQALKQQQEKATQAQKELDEKNKAALASNTKNEQIKKQNEEKLKQAQTKKDEESKKDKEIVTKTFSIKQSNGFITKNYSLLSSIVDFDDLDSSSAIKNQIEQQKLLMWLLFTIFILICSLLVVIVLQKIINENKAEIGVLKALGLKAIIISKSFLKLPIFALILAIIISCGFNYVFTNMLNNFVNQTLYLPPNVNIKLDYLLITSSIIIPLIVVTTYVYIYVKSLLSVKTLNLLNKVKNNKNYANFAFVKKLSTSAKLTFSTIINNFSKTLVIATIGVVVTLLISLTTLMYFSAVQTFSSIGGELVYDSISVKKNLETSQPSDKLQVYVKNPQISEVVDQKSNLKTFENKRYAINESTPLNLSILATNHIKTQVYDLSEYKPLLNKGIVLPAKYAQLYNLKVGDRLVTLINNKKIYLDISGFLNHDENIFAYTSTPYLSSKYNELGKANAHIAPSTDNFDKSLDYVINKDNASQILNQKLTNIINIVIVISLIIIAIVLPLILILISNIIDSNISTIATLKALGFNIGKIRKMLINPYFIVFVFGQIIAILINELLLGSKFASTFFGYLGYDVVFHSQIQGVLLTMIAICVIYQLIIIFSSQRINVVKTARILNDDSAIGKITNQDIKNYLQQQVRAVIDFDKPRHEFSYKFFPSLSKQEKKTINKKVWKIYWPKLLANVITNSSAIPESALKVVTSLMYKTYVAILYPIMSINNIIQQLNIVETILASSDVFLYQYFKSNKIREFKEIAYFKLRIHVLYAITKIGISYLLADALSMLIGLNTYQKSLLPLVLIGNAISELFNVVLPRGLSFEKYRLNYKPQLYLDVISKITTLGGTLLTISAFVFIKSDIRIYILIPYVLLILMSFVKFILSIIICSKNEFTNIKIYKMFTPFKTQAPSEVLKASLPNIRINIINMPITLVINIINARVFNTILTTNPDFAIFSAQQGLIQSIATIFDLTTIFETYNAFVTQYFSNSRFIKGINLFKYNRNLIFKYTPILKALPYIGSAILLAFFKFDQTTIIYILLSIVVEYLSVVLYRFIQIQNDLLIIGGEFKFAAYIAGMIQTFARIIQTLLLTYVGLFNLPSYVIQIVALIQLAISVTLIITLNKNRIKTGRWIYSINRKEFLSNVKEEYKNYDSLKTAYKSSKN